MLPIIPVYVAVTAGVGFLSTVLWNNSRFGEWVQIKPALGALVAPFAVPFVAVNIAINMAARAVIIKGKKQINAQDFNWEVKNPN